MLKIILLIVLTIIVAIPFAELAGYWLHVILHSHKSKMLGEAHMIHHMKLYGPDMPQRHKEYLSAETDRFSIFGIGMEWFATLGIYGLLWIIALVFLKVPWYLIFTFAVVHVSWATFLYMYMHHSMHLSDFWMAKHPWFKKWYLNIRDKHDIHHLHVDDKGRMNTNYGICFFWLDKIFGTYEPSDKAFNQKGYEQAKKLYKKVLS